ncbi:uncharacterized protein [Apostichopus japonicus]|uniref:uncharacterized protein isoform X1 n=1 Tax=Stichopus japonicus TaxID=307972 RepID=UPI003AB17E46
MNASKFVVVPVTYTKTRNKLTGVKMNTTSVFLVLVFSDFFVFMKAIVVNRTLQFEDPMKIYTVLQGDRVGLLCSPNDVDDIKIFTTGSLVASGRLEEPVSDEFDFECNETSCTLSIKQVEKKHADIYTCYLPQTSLKIEVLSSPSQDYPVCNSSYTNHTFFLDSFQEPFCFSCLSEEGFPAVNMSLSVNHGDGEINNISDENLTIYETNETVLISYSSYLDSSFNNSTFVCTVTQQLPAPYHSYNKSCSFGPLMLPVFSVSIHPSYYTVTTKNTENIILMCTSNVSGVVLEWTNIPLDDWNYNITRINDSSQLKILDYGSSIDLPITMQCSGSYGGITVSQYATIDIASTDEHIILSTLITAVLIVFVILVIIAIVLELIGVLINRKTKKQQLPAMSLTDTGLTRSNLSSQGNTQSPLPVTYTTTVSPESMNMQHRRMNEDLLYARSITLQQETEKETEQYFDINEVASFTYDKDDYLDPSQHETAVLYHDIS